MWFASLLDAADSTELPRRTNAMIQIASEQSAHRREVFSVDGARVTLDALHGWQCTCAASRPDVQCAHIEQAHDLRRRRGEKREPDTIELELSPQELRALSEGLAPEEDDAPTPRHLPSPQSRVHHWDWTTLVGAMALSVVSSGATYLAVKGGEPTRVDDPPLAAVPMAPEPEPAPHREALVQFVNPFDTTEIFQFPAGTPERNAREAVAELLLKRAQERLSAADALRHRLGSSDEQGRSGGILAQGN